MQQNDPGELLEVYDAEGNATGRARTRAAIHLDGDWHRAFHCWILRRGGAEVVLQQRSLGKDTFAGCWDAAAAGHWRFGESAQEAAREIEEELGLKVDFSALQYRGRERAQREFSNGLIDREFHEVYVLFDDRPLSDYRPEPAEVSDVAAFRLPDVVALASGHLAAIDAVETLRGPHVRVNRADVVPYSADRLGRLLGMLGPRNVLSRI